MPKDIMIDSPIQEQKKQPTIEEYESLKRKLNELENKTSKFFMGQQLLENRDSEWKEQNKMVYTANIRVFNRNDNQAPEYLVDIEPTGTYVGTDMKKKFIYKLKTVDTLGKFCELDMKEEDLHKDVQREVVKLVDKEEKEFVKVVGKTRMKSISPDRRRMIEGSIVPMTVTKKEVTFLAELPSGQKIKVKDKVLNP